MNTYQSSTRTTRTRTDTSPRKGGSGSGSTNAVALADALGCLGDPTRRAIFERLGSGPLAVVDLAAELPVSRPAVSQHLKVLKKSGLVRDERVGTRRLYSLDPVGIEGLRDYLDRFWNCALQSFKARVEAEHKRRTQ